VVCDRGFFGSDTAAEVFKAHGVAVVQPHFQDETAFPAPLVMESRAIASYRAGNEQSNARLKEQQILNYLPLEDVSLLPHYLCLAVYLANTVYKPLYDVAAAERTASDASDIGSQEASMPDAVTYFETLVATGPSTASSTSSSSSTAPALADLVFPEPAELTLPITADEYLPRAVRPTGEPSPKRAKVCVLCT
jgi:hypothetical protein